MQKPEIFIAVPKSSFKEAGSHNPIGSLTTDAGFPELVPKCFNLKDRFAIERPDVIYQVRAISDHTALTTWLLLQKDPALLIMGRDVMLQAVCAADELRSRFSVLQPEVDLDDISQPVPLGIGECTWEWQFPAEDVKGIPDAELTAMALAERIILSKSPAVARRMLLLLGLDPTRVIDSTSADLTVRNWQERFMGRIPVGGLEISGRGSTREANDLRAINHPAAYPFIHGLSTKEIATELYVINGSAAHGDLRRRMYETCLRLECAAGKKRKTSFKWHCLRSEVAKFRDLPAMGKITIAQLDGESEGPEGLVDCSIDVPEDRTSFVLSELNARGAKGVDYSTQPMSSCDDHPVTETVFPRV